MTVFHIHFLHCDLIHNGDVAPQNLLAATNKHLSPPAPAPAPTATAEAA
jgi:hypothetical protein